VWRTRNKYELSAQKHTLRATHTPASTHTRVHLYTFVYTYIIVLFMFSLVAGSFFHFFFIFLLFYIHFFFYPVRLFPRTLPPTDEHRSPPPAPLQFVCACVYNNALAVYAVTQLMPILYLYIYIHYTLCTYTRKSTCYTQE